ncbi:MAG: DUF952 domain-containing protein [Anaerolineales bacterium]
MIYHITSKSDWAAAQTQGEYSAPSLQSEGFIHCSTAEQVSHVASAFYRGRADLLLLVIDESKLTAGLKWEPPAGAPAPGISPADKFPHIFGAINFAAVVEVRDYDPA